LTSSNPERFALILRRIVARRAILITRSRQLRTRIPNGHLLRIGVALRSKVFGSSSRSRWLALAEDSDPISSSKLDLSMGKRMLSCNDVKGSELESKYAKNKARNDCLCMGTFRK